MGICKEFPYVVDACDVKTGLVNSLRAATRRIIAGVGAM